MSDGLLLAAQRARRRGARLLLPGVLLQLALALGPDLAHLGPQPVQAALDAARQRAPVLLPVHQVGAEPAQALDVLPGGRELARHAAVLGGVAEGDRPVVRAQGRLPGAVAAVEGRAHLALVDA